MILLHFDRGISTASDLESKGDMSTSITDERLEDLGNEFLSSKIRWRKHFNRQWLIEWPTAFETATRANIEAKKGEGKNIGDDDVTSFRFVFHVRAFFFSCYSL